MERSERIGLGVAIAGHAALLGVLSLTLLSPPKPIPPQKAIEVSLARDVGLEATTPVAAPPSEAEAPDEGAPEEAAPPPPAPEPQPVEKPAPAPVAKPEPKPVPQPKPAANPAPKPVPQPKPVAKPAPAPKPVAKPVAAPKPVAKPAAPAKPSAAKPNRAKATPAEDRQLAAIVKRAAAAGSGENATAKATRPRASRLGSDFLKGLSDTPSKAAASNAAPAVSISAQQLADIQSAIARQVQPCANRQVTPGPGAERIRVWVNLRFNRDGSLAVPPRVVNHDGVDEGNRRYLDRLDDIAIAVYSGCSPLHGLPAALYDVPRGWKNFTLRYKLPG